MLPNVIKTGFLIAVSLLVVLSIWAVDLDMGSSHPTSQPESVLSSEPSGQVELPSLSQDPIQDDTAASDSDDDDRYGPGDFASARQPVSSQTFSIAVGDDRLDHEPVDAAWAPRMESLMWSTIANVGEVLEVECRTTICRVLVVPSASESSEIANNRVLNDTFKSIISGSEGRLDGVRLGFFGAADGRSGMIIDLSGPRLDAMDSKIE